MSRRRPHETLHGIQLFPFVAVLLCTMGSLLVLLVGVARSSKSRAEDAAQAERAQAIAAAPVDERLVAQTRKLRQQIDLLRDQQRQADTALRDEQAQLSHLEDHMRRLQEELERLKASAVELNTLADARFDDRAQAEREIERLRQLLAERKETIEKLRKEKGQRRTYAVLPYATEKGTRRPPIYFECTSKSIVLQPEGIVFDLTDFRGPPGPGSPAAVAFRAAREQLVRQNPGAADGDMEPYALIIVRPDGQNAKELLCRVFDKAGIAFGYEIIESDANISYPQPDPQMLIVESQAVKIARDRLEMLAKAAPQAYDVRGLTRGPYASDEEEDDFADEEIVSTPDEDLDAGGGSVDQYAIDSTANYAKGGGGVRAAADRPVGGPGVARGARYIAAVPTGVGAMTESGMGGPNGSDMAAGPGYGGPGPGGGPAFPAAAPGLPGAMPGVKGADSAGHFGLPGGPGRNEMGPSGIASTTTMASAAEAASADQARTGSYGGLGDPGGHAVDGDRGTGRGGSGQGSGHPSGGGGGTGHGGGGALGLGQTGGGGGAVAGGGAAAGGGGGSSSLGSQNLVAGNNGQPGPAAAASGPAEYGNYNPYALPADAASREQMAAAGDRYDNPMVGPAPRARQQRPDPDREQELEAARRRRAKIRGKEWAISGRVDGAVPIRRTIRVVVRGDAIVILPEAGAKDAAAVPREIPLTGKTYQARDQISDALLGRIEGWGMAGQGLYWRPVIEVESNPEGEQRVAELERMLANSGIEMTTAKVAQNVEGGTPRASR